MYSKKIFWSALVGVALVAVSASAQTAQLTCDHVSLSPKGGTLKLLAALSYQERPAAAGWEIQLPEGWSLVGVGGGTPPQIASRAGSEGTLEFAFTEVPELSATFELTVQYPAQAKAAAINSTVFLRARGEQTTLRPRQLTVASP